MGLAKFKFKFFLDRFFEEMKRKRESPEKSNVTTWAQNQKKKLRSRSRKNHELEIVRGAHVLDA